MEPSDSDAPRPTLPAPDGSLIPDIPEGAVVQYEGQAENNEAGEHVQAAQGTEGLSHIDMPTWARVFQYEYPIDPRLYDPANNVAATAQPEITSGIGASVPALSPPSTSAHSTPMPALIPSPTNTLKLCSKKCAAPPRHATAFIRSMRPYGPLVERSQCNECTRMYNRGNMSPAEFQRLYVNPDEARHAEWRAEQRRASASAAASGSASAAASGSASAEAETATEGVGAALEAPQPEGAAQSGSTQPVPEDADTEQS